MATRTRQPAIGQHLPGRFRGKEAVIDEIDEYNQDVRAEGRTTKSIVYTDYMGVIMGSVTDIVNMISLVLIAFVSISLVVSSIMIGIITYISVLERTKEIGICVPWARRNAISPTCSMRRPSSSV